MRASLGFSLGPRSLGPPLPGPQSRTRGLRALPAPLPVTGTWMDRASLPELGSQCGFCLAGGRQTHLHRPGPQAGHRRRLAGRSHYEELLLQGGAADAVEGQDLHRELPFPAGRQGRGTRGRRAHSVRVRHGRGSSRSHSLPVGRPAARWSGQAPARRLVAPQVWETNVGGWCPWPGRSLYRRGLLGSPWKGRPGPVPGRLSTTLPPAPPEVGWVLQPGAGRRAPQRLQASGPSSLRKRTTVCK